MAFDRGSAAAWYRKNRARSRALFDLIAPEAYYEQPIALRHPIVFYEGHLPAFSFNTLVKRALGRRSIDARLETLFARGIDPHESTAAVADPRRAGGLWAGRGGGAGRRGVAPVRRRSRSAGARRARARGTGTPRRSAARSRRGGVHDPRA